MTRKWSTYWNSMYQRGTRSSSGLLWEKKKWLSTDTKPRWTYKKKYQKCLAKIRGQTHWDLEPAGYFLANLKGEIIEGEKNEKNNLLGMCTSSTQEQGVDRWWVNLKRGSLSLFSHLLYSLYTYILSSSFTKKRKRK